MTWDRLASLLETAEDRLGRHAGFLMGWLVLLWGMELVDGITPWNLDQWGIQPRTWRGLPGIFLAPFLHGGFTHLATNSVTLVALAWLTLITGWRPFWIVTAFAGLAGGLAVWLTGREGSTHLGCSILAFGYLGYLFLHGFLRRSLPWILLSVGATAAYGSMVAGLAVGSDGDVSREGHLYGWIFGLIAATALHRRAVT